MGCGEVGEVGWGSGEIVGVKLKLSDGVVHVG